MEKEELRSVKLLRNTSWATVGYMAYAIAGFVSRSVFVNHLGGTMTGLSTLFNSILNLLSVAELGLGTAIPVHLYKPIADRDERKISALLNLYGNAYKVIAVVVFFLGLAIIPFLDFFIKTDQSIEHMRWYFFLHIVRTVLSYCYASKGVLLTATQEGYRKTNITNGFLVASTVLQTWILYVTGSFTAYLLIYIISTLLTNVMVTRKTDQRHPYLKKYKNEKLDREEQKRIFAFVRATAVDRISASLKTASDNMIISGLVDVVITGIAGNYNMIINTVNTFLGFFFGSATEAAGNMVATATKDAQYRTFQDLGYVAFWLYGFLSAGMLCVMDSFVLDIWIRNSSMVLPPVTLRLLVLNFYLMGSCRAATVFFDVNGLIKRIPYMNLVNVLVNLVLSLWLVKPLGVDGVYIGTIVSYALTCLPLTHYYVLRYHFEGKYTPYLKLYLRCLILTGIGAAASVAVCTGIPVGGFLGLVCKVLVCSAVYNGIFIAGSFRSEEFRSLLGLAKTILRR